MCVNSKGSGQTVQIRRLAWAFAGRLYDKHHNLMSWLISWYVLLTHGYNKTIVNHGHWWLWLLTMVKSFLAMVTPVKSMVNPGLIIKMLSYDGCLIAMVMNFGHDQKLGTP